MTKRGKIFAGVGVLAAGIVALSAVLALAGRGPKQLQDVGSVITGRHAPTTCPLTGVQNKHVPNRPVLAIKVENLPEARPQSGLDKADIVYEEQVEGGITRFIALFQCQDSSRVGPVRSARLTDPPILIQYGHPIFGYAGGVGRVIAAVKSAGLKDENFDIAVSAYTRDPNRPEPHNLYTATKALYKAAHETGAPKPVFQYDTSITGHTRKAAFAHLGFSGYSDVFWRWNAKQGEWKRFHGTTAHTLEHGGQVSATNVVVQVVKYDYNTGISDVVGAPSPEAITVGRGKAYVFRNGRVIVGKWVRSSPSAPTQFETKGGDTIKLAPGNTWVELYPTDRPRIQIGR